jgi:hypothetical protein
MQTTKQNTKNKTQTETSTLAEKARNPRPLIAFDKSGNLIAGREYLEAIVKSGKAAHVDVAMGLESVADLMSKLGA